MPKGRSSEGKESTADLHRFFSNKGEFAEYLLLSFLRNATEPVGSWVLKAMLDAKGVQVGTATIGRILKDSDNRGLTELVGLQGRIITDKGHTYINDLSKRLERERLQEKLMSAAKPQNLDQLLDLLRVRKALECESACLAAIRAEPVHIKMLESSMQKHEERLSRGEDPTETAFEFHRIIAVAAQNSFLMATLDVLYFEEIRLESRVANLIKKSKAPEYAPEHAHIYEAIVRQDPEEASRRMRLHMDSLIQSIEAQDLTNNRNG